MAKGGQNDAKNWVLMSLRYEREILSHASLITISFRWTPSQRTYCLSKYNDGINTLREARTYI